MLKRKWISIIVAMSMVLTAAGCGSTGNTNNTTGETQAPAAQAETQKQETEAQSPETETEAEAKEPVTLKLMAMSTGDGNPEYDALIAAFEEKYPWITIEPEYLGIGDAYNNALLTRLRGSDAPDLFHVASGTGSVYSGILLAEAGYIMDLSGMPWADGLVPEANHDSWYYGDMLTAVPLQVAPIIVEYNVKAFEDLGIKVPTTMEEFFEAGRKAKEQGQNFLVLSGAHTGHSVHMLTSIAMSMVYSENPNWDADRYAGKVSFADSEGWKKTVDYFMQMCDEGFFVPGSEGMDTNSGHIALANGDGIARVCPAGNIHIVEAINEDLELSSFVMPGETADKTAVSGMMVDGIAAWSGTKYPEEVKLFMDFMVVDGGLNTYTNITGNIAIGDLLTGTVLNEKLACVSPLIEEKKLFSHPQEAWPGTAYDTLGAGVQSLMLGLVTPDEFLKQLDEAWDEGMAN